MTDVGIVGGAGYTAGELIRLLVHHPKVILRSIVSKSQGGLPVSSVHRDVLGEVDQTFDSRISDEVEFIFLCVGHGQSEEYLAQNPALLEKKIVDLSTDFRPRGSSHGFVYGLPELNRDLIQSASKIANPGCFATAVQMALLPLAKAQLLMHTIHVNGITGSTGAGQSPLPTTHFSWRNNNISIYKLFTHQHLAEIKESINQLQQSFDKEIIFIPYRGDFTRGIYASMYTQCDLSQEEAEELYKDYYYDHPFTVVSHQDIALKEVVNTNKCHLQITVHNGLIHVSSIIDNLLKGAAGHAVQNMNLIMGWPEDTGLKLKSIGF